MCRRPSRIAAGWPVAGSALAVAPPPPVGSACSASSGRQPPPHLRRSQHPCRRHLRWRLRSPPARHLPPPHGRRPPALAAGRPPPAGAARGQRPFAAAPTYGTGTGRIRTGPGSAGSSGRQRPLLELVEGPMFPVCSVRGRVMELKPWVLGRRVTQVGAEGMGWVSGTYLLTLWGVAACASRLFTGGTQELAEIERRAEQAALAGYPHSPRCPNAEIYRLVSPHGR